MDNYLILQKMKVTEAGMDSSPIISGFPSLPAVMGFVHALQRLVQKRLPEVSFPKAGICSHAFDPGVHRTGEGVKPALTKNPPYARKHLEKGVPFIEEGKADMTVSIVIQIEGGSFDQASLKAQITSALPRLRFSGGTIWSPNNILIRSCAKDDEEGHKKILRSIMPGFVLQDRKDLVEKSMDAGSDALDAILDHLEVQRQNLPDHDGLSPAKSRWVRKSGEPGWLVPIAVGYKAISEVSQVKNQRDPECQHHFAENVLTLGEFIMPVRLDTVESLLWQSYIDDKEGLYLYTQQ